jgi:hypothetical protein
MNNMETKVNVRFSVIKIMRRFALMIIIRVIRIVIKQEMKGGREGGREIMGLNNKVEIDEKEDDLYMNLYKLIFV